MCEYAARTVVVAQWSLLSPEDLGSNPVINSLTPTGVFQNQYYSIVKEVLTQLVSKRTENLNFAKMF